MRQPPGPRRRIPGANALAMQRHPLEFLTALTRRYGDAVRFTVGPQEMFLFSAPELVREVLVVRSGSFRKASIQRSRPVLGEGLLTSEGELHRRQRRLVQPAFHRERLDEYGALMVAFAARERDRWRDGQLMELKQLTIRITMSIAAKALFGAEVESRSGEIGAALTAMMENFPAVTDPLTMFVRRVRASLRRRLRRPDAAAHNRRKLDSLIFEMIEERRNAKTSGHDVLSMLLAARDDEAGDGTMSDQQVRDEVMTLFAAGYETSSNALSFTFSLIARNPEWEATLHREIDSVIGDRLPCAADFPHLEVAQGIFAESLRLYPPVWGMDRLAAEDVEIGGWGVPAGGVVFLSQWVTHRDPRWWPDPERFDPTRFRREAVAARPKFAYFPFGGGSRMCLGEGFAWTEAVLVLVTIAQQWRLRPTSDRPIEPRALLTLRPKRPVMVRLERRSR